MSYRKPMPCLSPSLSQGSAPQKENRITCGLSRAVFFLFFFFLWAVSFFFLFFSFFSSSFFAFLVLLFAFVEKTGEEDSGEEDSSWILTSTVWDALLKPEKKKKRERDKR